MNIALSTIVAALSVSEGLSIASIGLYISANRQVTSSLLCWCLFGLGVWQCCQVVQSMQSCPLPLLFVGLVGFCSRAATYVLGKRILLVTGNTMDVVRVVVAATATVGTAVSTLSLGMHLPLLLSSLDSGPVIVSSVVVKQFAYLVTANCIFFILTNWFTWRLINVCDKMNIFVKMVSWVSVGVIWATSFVVDSFMTNDLLIGLGIVSLAGLLNGYNSNKQILNTSVATPGSPHSSRAQEQC
jgi:hypothetical protein